MKNNFSDIIYLEPNQIIINRELRQRNVIDTSDIIDSIRENGIINPIIIEKISTELPLGIIDIEYILIAGERRLACAIELQTQVPCRLFSSLSPLEASVIEFDENHKRQNLSWREEVRAIGDIHKLYVAQDKSHTQQLTAYHLSLSESKLKEILYVYDNLNEKILTHANNLTQARDILHRFKSPKSIEITKNIKQIIDSKPLPDYLIPKSKEVAKLSLNFDTTGLGPEPTRGERGEENSSSIILNQDFISWIDTYQGPKFNFIHCDFPQSEKNFWQITFSFLNNIDKILDNSAHILFWFNIKRYEDVLHYFRGPEILKNAIFHPPLFWYKSDTKQNYIIGEEPRNTYETALIITHENRDFKKQIQNGYHSPRASMPICPNQKPINMLKYFFQTFIDEETNFLDPSCGSGASLIAAEELKAKTIFGLEINPSRYQKANEKILRQRELNKLLEK